MTIAQLEEVAHRLPELIAALQPGEQLTIVHHGEAVATLTREAPGDWGCAAGSAKHLPHWMAIDFDDPLGPFAEFET